MNTCNCLVVCGPTACGKTSLGVALAERLGGVVLSADSRQIYRGMDIGTGKDLCEYVRHGQPIPYRLIDIAEPGEIYTLYRYLNDFNIAFNETIAGGKLPVIVGGTGLYVEAAVKQYEVPHSPEDAALRESLMSEDKEILEKRLEALSAELFARTDLTSKKRIVRSIEIALSKEAEPDLPDRVPLCEPMRPLVVGLAPGRQTVLDRIDRRLDERLSSGMIDEIRGLCESVPRERMLMFGMEYKHIALYCYGELSYEAMVEQLRASIHRLSKRQMTWFRGMERRGIPVRWYEGPDEERVFQDIASFFGR
jgi:tRNA dimethylallyltransferase